MRAARLAAAGMAAFLTGACELREITLASPEDVVVAEVVLRAGSAVQTAYLHRTSSSVGGAAVHGAEIRVTEGGTDRTFLMEVVTDSLCVAPPPPAHDPGIGTCYAAVGARALVERGRTYSLRIDLQGGGVLTGTTTVPGDFSVVRPSSIGCTLPPDTLFEITWSASAGTAVYLVEATMRDLRRALRERGLDVPGDLPVELLGLSIGATDTTLVFPTELGLFDRFDDALHPILIGLRGGVPPGVSSEISVSAADRNYVNWVRGGNFNPSGLVRISSLRGDGIGVFGSLATETLGIYTPPAGQGLPPCH